MPITQTRADLIEEIKRCAVPLLLPYGLKRLSLFGSVARGDYEAESDIDLLVEFEVPRRQPLGLIGWIHLESELSQLLGRKVDLVSIHGLNYHLLPIIEPDLVELYEAA